MVPQRPLWGHFNRHFDRQLLAAHRPSDETAMRSFGEFSTDTKAVVRRDAIQARVGIAPAKRGNASPILAG